MIPSQVMRISGANSKGPGLSSEYCKERATIYLLSLLSLLSLKAEMKGPDGSQLLRVSEVMAPAITPQHGCMNSVLVKLEILQGLPTCE